MALTERTQVLLTPAQRSRLERIAAERGISVGAVIRQAIDALVGRPQLSREEAARRLLAMEAPVDDWEIMEEEIIRGHIGDDCLP